MTASAEPAPATPLPDRRLGANLICMAAMLIWATGFPAVDRLLPDIAPLALTGLRMGLAVVVLLPLWALIDGAGALRRAPWRRGLWLGALGFGLGAYLLVEAQHLTDAVTTAVISATMPVIGIALECLFDGRRLTRRLLAGLALSLVGGTLAYAARLGDFGLGWGALAAFASVTIFTLASRQTARLPGLSATGASAVTFTGAALATGIAALALAATGGGGVSWGMLDGTDLALLLYYGCISLALSQVLWIVGVARLGIGVAAMHINAAPFYVMLIVWALGGPFNALQLGGAVLVAAGVILAQPPRRPARVAGREPR